MTKEELYAKYAEQVQQKAKDYLEKQLGEDRTFMPKDIFEDAYTDLYNTFISGANCARDILIELLTEYHKANS